MKARPTRKKGKSSEVDKNFKIMTSLLTEKDLVVSNQKPTHLKLTTKKPVITSLNKKP